MAKRRGAQPGNRNAIKHGLYAKQLGAEALQLLEAARDLSPRDLAGEIALLRSRVAVLVAAAPDRIDLLAGALRTLVQLVSANYRLSPDAQHDVTEALRRAHEELFGAMHGEEDLP